LYSTYSHTLALSLDVINLLLNQPNWLQTGVASVSEELVRVIDHDYCKSQDQKRNII